MNRSTRLLINCRIATMVAGGEPYGAIADGAILIRDGRIAWVGPRADLPVHKAVETDRLDGRWVTPGLIDCHVHVVLSEINIRNLENYPITLMTARAMRLMGGMAINWKMQRRTPARSQRRKNCMKGCPCCGRP